MQNSEFQKDMFVSWSHVCKLQKQIDEEDEKEKESSEIGNVTIDKEPKSERGRDLRETSETLQFSAAEYFSPGHCSNISLSMNPNLVPNYSFTEMSVYHGDMEGGKLNMNQDDCLSVDEITRLKRSWWIHLTRVGKEGGNAKFSIATNESDKSNSYKSVYNRIGNEMEHL